MSIIQDPCHHFIRGGAGKCSIYEGPTMVGADGTRKFFKFSPTRITKKGTFLGKIPKSLQI